MSFPIKKWKKISNFSKKIFGCFKLSLSSSKQSFNYLKKLNFKTLKKDLFNKKRRDDFDCEKEEEDHHQCEEEEEDHQREEEKCTHLWHAIRNVDIFSNIVERLNDTDKKLFASASRTSREILKQSFFCVDKEGERDKWDELLKKTKLKI